jgi:hypothetical protein
MFALMIALQVAAAQPAQPLVPIIEPSGRIAKILGKNDGRTQRTAYRVKSVREEYEILHVFGLEPGVQSLVIGDNGKAFDLHEAKNLRTGETVELWFDISSFYGAGF